MYFIVPKEILKDLDLGGTEDNEPDDSDYTGFIEEPRYVPPATMGPLLEATQPPKILASTLKPILGMVKKNIYDFFFFLRSLKRNMILMS